MQEPTQTSSIPEHQTRIIPWAESRSLPFESPSLSESNSSHLQPPSSEISPATSPHPGHQHHHQQQQRQEHQQHHQQLSHHQHSQISPHHHHHLHHYHHQQQQQQHQQPQLLAPQETSHNYLQHSPHPHHQQQHQDQQHQQLHHQQHQQQQLPQHQQQVLIHEPHHQQQHHHQNLPANINDNENIISTSTTNNSNHLHVSESSKNVTYIIQSAPSAYQVVEPGKVVHHFEYANENHHHHLTTTSIMTQNDIRVELPEGEEGRGGGGGETRGVEARAGIVVKEEEEEEEEEVAKRGRKRAREDDDVHQPGSKLSASSRCDVCGEQASGHYFGALVCLPCKSFFIRCTKDGPPNFSGQCGGKCDVLKGGRVRCQHCRFQKCIKAGMYRKEKPEAVEPAEGQMLCKVCGDIANGVHFGVTTCEGCKKFFRRGLKENRTYACKGDMSCSINPRMRNNCRYCRYQKCIYEGMSREAIKMGRPKKGELVIRTASINSKTPVTARKNGFTRQLLRPGEKQCPSSYPNHSPAYADEYGNSQSDDREMYNPQNSHHIHHQINDHTHHPHQLQHHHVNQQQQDEINMHHSHQQQQQQQQQQQGQSAGSGFSLGTLLHDSITVEDWDVGPAVMTSSSDHQTPHGTMTPSSGGGSMIVGHAQSTGGNIRVLEPSDIRLSISPRQQRQTSPGVTMVSDNSNPVINLQQAHRNHLHPQQQQQSRQFYNNDNIHHPHHNSTPKHTSPAHHLDLSNVQQQQQQQQPGDAIPVFDYLENDDPMTDQQVRIVKFEKPGLVDAKEEPFPTSVNMDEIQNFHTLTKVNFQQYNPQPSPYTDSNPHSPLDAKMVIPVSQLEPSVDSQIIVYSSNNRQDQSSPNPSNLIVSHPNMSLKRSPPAPGYENNTFDNPDRLNLTPMQSEVVNLSQNQSIVSLQNANAAALPLTSEDLVASISHPVINGTNLVLLRNNNSMSPAVSTYKTNSNRNNNNNAIFTSNMNVSSPINSNIISQAMEIASQESYSNESNLEPYLPSESRKVQSMTNFQQLNDNNNDNISQLRDFEELLLNKFGTKIIAKQQIQIHNSHSMDDLRIRKGQNSNDSDFITVGDRELIRTGPSTQGIASLPNILEAQLNNGVNVTNTKMITTNSNGIAGKIYALNVNNNNNNDNNINNNTILDNLKIRQINPPRAADHSASSNSFNEKDALDSAELHETNRIYMAIDNSCATIGCYRRESKWKNAFDDPAVQAKLSTVDFLPEVSHSYWHRFQPKSCHLTPERQRTIDVICRAFRNLHTTYMSCETDCPKPSCSSSLEFWYYIQQTIARHVVAGQQFCKNIPEYLKLDIQDRISLGKHVGFGLMVLIACTEFYDPEAKDLKKVWTCKMPVHGALKGYREYLLSLGDKIHQMGVDRAETALLCAISMTSIDCPSLVKPDTVSEVQSVLIESLEAYISAKGHPGARLQILLGLMPQVRLMTVWYNNLMKKMSLPCDIINNKLCKKACMKTSGRIAT